jgi:hypothetical protein
VQVVGVGLFEPTEQGQRGRSLRVLLVDQRNLFGGDLAGSFPGDVRSHAVGHEEHPAPRLELLGADRGNHRQGVLVVRATPPDVGSVAVQEGGACSHASTA